jgi:hypothetical protein
VALSEEEAGQGGLVAVGDDTEGFAGVAVDDDCDVAVAAPQRRLVNEDPPAAPAPFLLGDFDITEYRGALTLNLAITARERLPTHRAVSTLTGRPELSFPVS